MARGGDVEGLIFEATLTSYRGEEELKSYTLQIESDGDNSLASFLAPSRSRGLKMLIRSRNMWFLSPSTKRPVPISPRQRLLGEASNGDIATTNYSRDYEATIVGEEIVDDTPCHVLSLVATNDNATYAKLRYYISKEQKLGIRAEYLTASDRLLKVAHLEYNNSLSVDDRELAFVSRMTVVDGINTRDRTVMKYSDVRVESISRDRFDTRSLLRG